jgi:DNA-binding transcriptional MocR family regulator
MADEILAGYRMLGARECIFRWLLLPEGLTSEGFEQAALRSGVRVYGSHRFAVGGVKPEEAARLAISAPNSMEELNEALCILRNVLRQAK